MGFREEGKWWVSPANYHPEVLPEFPKNIEILDTTLRDGEQEPSIVLTKEDKIAIAKKLDEAGVHRIEAGTPVSSADDEQAIREICKLGLNAKIYCFVRNMVSDIELAKDCGVYGVLAEVPGSEHLLKGGSGWTAEKAIAAACASTKRAHELGLQVTFFPADGSRADLDFLCNTLNAIIDGGGHVDSVALVDTFGAFSPEGAAFTVKQLLERVGKPVEAHFHEDFGVSVATTIAALKAGATVAHVTVNGIGERAGSCPLEPLVMSMQCLYGYDTGVRSDKLLELSQLVAELTEKPVPASKPIVGDRIFGWETGLPVGYWNSARKIDPLIMLPYKWTMTGQREPYIYMGKKSGTANISMWNEELGLDPIEDKDEALALLGEVKKLALSLKRDITKEEYLNLYKNR